MGPVNSASPFLLQIRHRLTNSHIFLFSFYVYIFDHRKTTGRLKHKLFDIAWWYGFDADVVCCLTSVVNFTWGLHIDQIHILQKFNITFSVPCHDNSVLRLPGNSVKVFQEELSHSGVLRFLVNLVNRFSVRCLRSNVSKYLDNSATLCPDNSARVSPDNSAGI